MPPDAAERSILELLRRSGADGLVAECAPPEVERLHRRPA
jgi:hypothetical protein